MKEAGMLDYNYHCSLIYILICIWTKPVNFTDGHFSQYAAQYLSVRLEQFFYDCTKILINLKFHLKRECSLRLKIHCPVCTVHYLVLYF